MIHHYVLIAHGEYSDYRATPFRVLKPFTFKDLRSLYRSRDTDAESFVAWMVQQGYIEDADVPTFYLDDGLHMHDELATFPFVAEGEPIPEWVKPEAPPPPAPRIPTVYVGPPHHVNCRSAPPDPPRTPGPAYLGPRSERHIRAKVKALGGRAYRKRGANLLQVHAGPWRVDFNVPRGLLTGSRYPGRTLFTESNRDLDGEEWYRQMMDVFYMPVS